MTPVVAHNETLERKIDAFDRQRHSVFEALVRELQQAASSPEEADFGTVVSHAQRVLGRTDLQMSTLFKVSRPTINRWIRGVTAPHPMLRKAVYDALLAEVRVALKSIRVPA